MESGRPAAVERDPALEFIHHLDGATFDQVFHVTAKKRMGFERVLHDCVEFQIALLEKIAAAECVFNRANAAVRQGGVMGTHIDRVVHGRLQAAHHLIGHICQGTGASIAAGDDQRDARLIDQNGIHLVDNGRGKGTVHLLVQAKREPVAQDVEADLIGGSVRNVAGVRSTALGGRHALLHVACGEAQKTVDVPHPASVAAGQIIVDGHDVHAL